jgi:hypothetical protein
MPKPSSYTSDLQVQWVNAAASKQQNQDPPPQASRTPISDASASDAPPVNPPPLEGEVLPDDRDDSRDNPSPPRHLPARRAATPLAINTPIGAIPAQFSEAEAAAIPLVPKKRIALIKLTQGSSFRAAADAAGSTGRRSTSG